MTPLLALSVALALVLAGCGSPTSNVRRDVDLSGSLPRAIGLGAFAPACIMFCFPSASFTQGDVAREVIEEGEPLIVHGSTSKEKQPKGVPP